MRRARTGFGQRRAAGYSQGLITVFLLFLLAVAGVAWVYAGMTAREQWPVRWLEIDGAFERVSAEQMRSTLAPVATGSFFTVNLAAVRAAAFRQPWVAEATVQKTWPDTVRVRIREYAPVAHWTGGRLVSGSGRAFQVPGADEMQGLPWLEGPDEQLGTVFESWQQFNNELQPIGLEIERIHLDPRGAWFVELSSGTEVQVGRGEPEVRLRRLIQSWQTLMRDRELAPQGVDLRYTNGFAVRWPAPPDKLAGTYGKEN